MRLNLFLLCALFATISQAQTYSFLTFTETDGTETSIAAEGTVITFDDGYINATTSDHVAYTFFLSEMASLRFSETATGIENTILTPAGQQSLVKVYDTAGRLVRAYTGNPDNALNGLKASGVYIVKSNGTTQKRFVR
ncbi:MAG: T9SS type A sorting domain-containing protein [Bacteroidaceae bacterium]|nr:T9SS type A sorting domain-containing protein [Bacteroidaceae bacterium]